MLRVTPSRQTIIKQCWNPFSVLTFEVHLLSLTRKECLETVLWDSEYAQGL
jgi:hypothetical protein